jgi:uncharacterized damage-inducible protein DinB
MIDMASLIELAFADVDQEIAATRRVIERLPDDRWDWKPHGRSNSLGDLASHVVNIVGWLAPILTTDELDFAANPPPPPAAGHQDLLQALDSHVADLHTALQSLDEAGLSSDWTFRVGDHVVFSRPRLVVFRSFGMSHAVHHRAQLTVYLRLLDLSVPPVYGPTADER